jgi:hypothetical protein
VRDGGVDAPPGLGAGVPFVACDDALDEAMSGYSSGEGDESQEAREDG